MQHNDQDLVENIIRSAQKEGSSDADVMLIKSADTSVSIRNGKQESVERSESVALGLRVLIGKKQAIISSNNIQPDKIDSLIKQAVAMAKCAPDDPYARIAGIDEYTKISRDIESIDPNEPDIDWLKAQAEQAEQAALEMAGITNSEGADAGHGKNHIILATSNGFNQCYSNSRTSVSLSVIAGEGTSMERDYDYSTACFVEDVEKAEILGKNAANKAIKRLNPQKVKTGQYPIMMSPDIARRLVGNFAAAINGAAVARGSSFLMHEKGKRIFPEHVTIIDDPAIKRGLASRPFDAEGIAGKKRAVIEGGILHSWLLDLRSAAQLGMSTTGHATRRTSGAPSPAPTNMSVQPGKKTPDELISSLDKGIYITDTFGMGVNGVTGDYSQGAAGFMIENGKITYPVSEFTIASTLQTMFSNLEVASDLKYKSSINCPTAFVGEMMVAGNAV